MRILVANHTGSIGGAERALLLLLEELRVDHDIAVACPRGGSLAAALDRAAIRRVPSPTCEASFRLHLVHTPVGVAQLCAGGISLAASARRFQADVLYANTIRAGLMGALATKLGGPPLVVRVHDCLPKTAVGHAVGLVIAATAHAVLAVSDYTAERFNEGRARRVATRVYNAIDHAHFDPETVTPGPLRDELGIGPEAALLGHVAQITPWKGQDDAIRTLAKLRDGRLDAHLVLVGAITFQGKQVRHDNPAYLRALHRLVNELGVGDAVHFIGQREDVAAVLGALDVLLHPALEDPFGLVVIESMAMGTPVVVASPGGAAELIEDGVSGCVLPARRPDLWAETVRGLILDPSGRERMATCGQEVAQRLREDVHAHAVESVLEEAASGRSEATIGQPDRPAVPGAVPSVAADRRIADDDPLEALAAELERNSRPGAARTAVRGTAAIRGTAPRPVTDQTSRRESARHQPAPVLGSDLAWSIAAGGLGAIVLALVLTKSMQAACALVLILLVVSIYLRDRRYGLAALFVFWFLAPWLRRLFDLLTGYVNTDPLSVAPFLATAAVASIELSRTTLPPRVLRILLLITAGFACGLPVGLVHPAAAMYAFLAYIAGVSGIILGFAEPGRLHDSVLRKVLLYGMVPIAAYAVIQRAVPLASWDRDWIQATGLTSIGTSSNGKVRVFASLNSPGALAALLGLSLLCYLTVRRHRGLAVLGAVLLTIALALTFVRSAWIALILGAVAHVIASGGRSARLVFGALAIVAAAAVALGPVSPVAHEVVNRFSTIGSFSTDTSATARTATLSETLPAALGAPLGHGLGSAGEPSKLSGNSTLRAPDNGYLALLYQVGPFGFVLVAAAVCVILRAAWIGARARAPGQQLRLLLFAMLIFLLVSLASGDQLYGSLGVVFWMIGGQALAFEQRHRVRNAAIASPYASSRRSTTLVHV